MFKTCKVFLILFSLFFLTVSAHGAQSTADVAASKELKREALVIIRNATSDAQRAKKYTVGAGDVLDILVYGEGDMFPADTTDGMIDDMGGQTSRSTGGYGYGYGGYRKNLPEGIPVRMDGQISLKHIGDVEVAGLTLTEIADYLKILYSTVFDDPMVTVVLGESKSKHFTVMGKVVNPGLYTIQYPINIIQAIAQCGGLSEWANSDITLVRQTIWDDKALFIGNTLEVDYDMFIEGKDLQKNIVVQPEDILIVH